MENEKIKELVKKLNLQKPIVFFDTETTGLDVAVDRIVSISASKLMPDGEIITKNTLINPTISISKESTDIHGITNEMVQDKPKFSQLAKSMYDFMNDCYLGGYNNNYFDNCILQEEFLRCGINYPNKHTVSVDACNIFKTYEKRDLASALKFYCNEVIENAHNAEADNTATIKVFLSQCQHYEDLKDKNIEQIAKIGTNENYVDVQGKIIIDTDGDYCWNFGKPKGKKIKKEQGFADWIMANSFPQSFKNLVYEIISEIRNENN